MTEMSKPDNEKLVSDVYTKALETRAANGPLGEAEQVVYEIEMLSQEVNSGASFEQYFRWASRDELARIEARLHDLGLRPVADLVKRAFAVAMPDGIPHSDEAKEALTEWTPEQEAQLQALAEEFTEFNGTITNALADSYRRGRPDR
jgi:uncharacterized protein DUF4375